MNEHFIKNIKIKNFKCFEDFKAEGFGRVNLIGGKNNVGKTAFMEAVYLINSKTNLNLNNIIKIRFMADILLDLWNEIGKKFITNSIKEKVKNYNNYKVTSNLNNIEVDIYFKSSIKQTKKHYEELYSKMIQNELENRLDRFLNKFDNSIEKFRIINSEPHCKKDNKFYNLNEFGDGLGKYIYFIMLLLSEKNSIILIDEIENGIHYTNLDKLWETILTISKDQNVQVFATTHSKECIESYARVAKKLEDEEITYTILTKLDDGSIDAGVYTSSMLINTIDQEHEVRGW